eukprot:6173677-Pyramimonas_sp.AAC.1
MKSSQLNAETRVTLLMPAGPAFEWGPLQEQAAIHFPLVPRNKRPGYGKVRHPCRAHVAPHEGIIGKKWYEDPIDQEEVWPGDEQPELKHDSQDNWGVEADDVF